MHFDLDLITLLAVPPRPTLSITPNPLYFSITSDPRHAAVFIPIAHWRFKRKAREYPSRHDGWPQCHGANQVGQSLQGSGPVALDPLYAIAGK